LEVLVMIRLVISEETNNIYSGIKYGF